MALAEIHQAVCANALAVRVLCNLRVLFADCNPRSGEAKFFALAPENSFAICLCHFIPLRSGGPLAPSGDNRTPVPIPLSTPYFEHKTGCGGLEEVRQREARAQPPPALDPCPKAEA